MLFANLKGSLKDGVRHAYLLFGDDVFLVNKAVELIIEAVGAGADVKRLDEGATSAEVITRCRTVSMFGGRRVVIVRPVADKFFDKAVGAYLLKPDDGCVLVLVCDKAANVKNIEAVDCNPMSEDLVVKLICRACVEAGKKINEDAARLLARYSDNNFARVDNELRKILHYYNEQAVITAQDVEAIAVRSESFQIYELGNAVMKRDVVTAEKIYENLVASGVEEYAIFGNIMSSIRRAFWAVSTKAPAEAVATLFKCHPYAITAARRDYAVLRDKIAGIYKRAAHLEYQIKGGKISVASAITLLQGLFF